MAKSLNDFSLLDIAPPSILNDKKVIALLKALNPELREISEDISEVLIYSRIDKLPEPVLDLLAWQWHVDFYELAKNIDAKREMVKGSIKWHRHKGTRGAIIQALEMLGVEAKFTAWFDDEDNKDNPYTFAIDAKLTGDFWERVDWTKPTQTIRRAIIESKAARSYMSRLFVYFEGEATQDITVGVAGFSGSHHVIGLTEHTQAEAESRIQLGVSGFSGSHHVINLTEKTHAEAISGINIGAGLFSGVHHKIGLISQTESRCNLRLVSKVGMNQGTHYVIGIRHSKEFNATQNISAGQAINHAIHSRISIKEV